MEIKTLWTCKNCGFTTEDCEDANDCMCGYVSNATEKKWVAVDDVIEEIRRIKMDKDEIVYNNATPDWNNSLLVLEKRLSQSGKKEVEK